MNKYRVKSGPLVGVIIEAVDILDASRKLDELRKKLIPVSLDLESL